MWHFFITEVASSIAFVRPKAFKLSFISGPHFNKKGLAGRIKKKKVYAGHNRRLKAHFYYKNNSFSNNLGDFNDVAGRTNTYDGLRVRVPWPKVYCQTISFWIYFLKNQLIIVKSSSRNCDLNKVVLDFYIKCHMKKNLTPWKNINSINSFGEKNL